MSEARNFGTIAAEELGSALDPDELSSDLDCDEVGSARTLFQAGRSSFDHGDLRNAVLCFGLAEKLFSKAAEQSEAYIARQWYGASKRYESPS